jgi:hypothetical protein
MKIQNFKQELNHPQSSVRKAMGLAGLNSDIPKVNGDSDFFSSFGIVDQKNLTEDYDESELDLPEV